jgi:ABC-2 type transport system permease protein
MRSVKAIFVKQAKDVLQNPMILVEFIIFPAIAFIMTEMVAKSNPDIPNNMFVTMMAPIFAGMALITAMAGTIAEDVERKSLRFLMMAGVKPHEYLLGAGGFNLFAGIIVSAVFALMGDFSTPESVKFLGIMILSVAASLLLGASIGMLSKNQQSATAIGVPFAMVLGFTPMIAQFNETVESAAGILYTQQLNVIVNDFSANFTRAMLVIGGNMAVLLILFVLAHKKKGLSV